MNDMNKEHTTIITERMRCGAERVYSTRGIVTYGAFSDNRIKAYREYNQVRREESIFFNVFLANSQN